MQGGKIIDLSGHYVKDDLNEDSVVLDFGANVGSFSKAILRRYNCKVFAYEAYPKICEKYLSRIKSPNFTYYNNAVWHKNERIKFWNYGSEWAVGAKLNPWGANSLFERLDEQDHDRFGNKMTKEQITVDAIAIDDILAQHKMVDYVKFDIEGAEVDVLLNVSDKQISKCKQIDVEFHHFLNDKSEKQVTLESIEDIKSKFSRLSYKFIKHGHHPDYFFYRDDLSTGGSK